MGLKALVYSDLQATDGHERSFQNPAVPLQLLRVKKFYTDLFRIFQEHRCDCLWDLGDTTDDRSALPIPAIDAVLAGLDPFPVHELNFKLVGNHEQYLRDCTLSVGCLFRSKFKVVEKTEILEIPGDTLIVLAAYPATDAALAAWLDATAYAYRNYARRLLLGHFQVAGCTLNSGVALQGIPRATVEKYTLSLLGHVHKPQQAGRNAFYVGSPFQQNFGERGEPKRVAVVDLETLQVTWVPLPGYPEYRVLPFAEWVAMVSKTDENRYQVILRTTAEAEAYYAHPLMSRADPAYNYELAAEAKAATREHQVWTTRDLLQRWQAEKPPAAAGISLSAADVLEVGLALAESEIE